MKHFRTLCALCILTSALFTVSTPSFAVDLIIPDTGQTLCYDWTDIMTCPSPGQDFYGQDGNYLINPPSLTDNLNGTVTDNLTGLIWEQKTAANEALRYTYSAAVNYCESLILGGHDDWRVPTRKEYSTILNLGRTSPALDTTYFPYYTTPPVNGWTSTSYHMDQTKKWAVLISWGTTFPDVTTKTYKVRCVSGTAEPMADYTDNMDGTVTDNVTGLMWEQKTDDGGPRDKDKTYTWKDALAYCESLVLGERSDWRMPTPKELERLVDLTKSGPAIDTNYFPNTNSGKYWTGTTCSGCHKHKAFAMDFNDGTLYFGQKQIKSPDGYFPDPPQYEYWYVRAVRNATDPDNDGIFDPADNCPTVINPGQADADQDGMGDVCDNCPNDSQNDIDGDGVCGNVDNCPTLSNADQKDSDSDGFGDVCDETPTAITLSSFSATSKRSTVILNWATESEIDNIGFNIFRADSEYGEYIKINSFLIPAEGSPSQGASYEFIDRGLTNGKTYFYKLEDIDFSGKSIMHGPVSAIPRWIFGIFRK